MSMIIRHTDNEIIIENLIQGFINTYPHIIRSSKSSRAVYNKSIKKNKIILLSGGGSGHEPAHIGYVGDNMLDGAIMGDIFEPPSSDDILVAIEETYNGVGTLLIIKNFEKDLNNFLRAESLAKAKGLNVDHVIVTDDCSVEYNTFEKRRRGVAGTIFVHKILGAAALQITNLAELKLLGESIIESINTIGVAFSSNDSIGNINKQYTLKTDEMYFGIGIHGEPGYRIEKIKSSERIAVELFNKLIQQYDKKILNNVALIVNGLGSTSLLELSIFMNHIIDLLDIKNINPKFSLLGNFLTSYNTDGLSLTFLDLKEDNWLQYLMMKTNAFGWPNR